MAAATRDGGGGGGGGGPEVFVWGENAAGELSVGGQAKRDVAAPRPMRVPAGGLAAVAFGLSHTVALGAASGQPMTCGSWISGRLGHKGVTRNLARLKRLALPSRVAHVACGDHHSVALLATGEMYAWGGSRGGKTGHQGNGVLSVPVGGVAQVDSGRGHTVLCTDKGQAWQLGDGSAVPRLVPGLDRAFVSRVACGSGHTLALASDGSVFAWGAGEFGQLGLGDAADRDAPEPVRALAPGAHKENGLALGPVRGMACGDKHSVVVTACGRVLTFGCGAQGQLGHGGASNERLPRVVEALERLAPPASPGAPARSVAVLGGGGGGGGGKASGGRSLAVQVAAGSRHTLALDDAGRVYAWGCNGHGQLGVSGGAGGTRPSPVAVGGALEGVEVREIAAGGAHSLASTRSFKGTREMMRVIAALDGSDAAGAGAAAASPPRAAPATPGSPSRREAGRLAVTHTPSPAKGGGPVAATPIRALAWDDPTPFSSPVRVASRERKRREDRTPAAGTPDGALSDTPLYSPDGFTHRVTTNLSSSMTQTLHEVSPSPARSSRAAVAVTAAAAAASPARPAAGGAAAAGPRVEVLRSPQVRMLHRYATFFSLRPEAEVRALIESRVSQLQALDMDESLLFHSVNASPASPPAPDADRLVPAPLRVTLLLVYSPDHDAAGAPAGGGLPLWAALLSRGTAPLLVCPPLFRELRPLDG